MKRLITIALCSLAIACATTLDYEICDDANTVCNDTNNNIVVE